VSNLFSEYQVGDVLYAVTDCPYRYLAKVVAIVAFNDEGILVQDTQGVQQQFDRLGYTEYDSITMKHHVFLTKDLQLLDKPVEMKTICPAGHCYEYGEYRECPYCLTSHFFRDVGHPRKIFAALSQELQDELVKRMDAIRLNNA
jgi:hypothetical protein